MRGSKSKREKSWQWMALVTNRELSGSATKNRELPFPDWVIHSLFTSFPFPGLIDNTLYPTLLYSTLNLPLHTTTDTMVLCTPTNPSFLVWFPPCFPLDLIILYPFQYVLYNAVLPQSPPTTLPELLRTFRTPWNSDRSCPWFRDHYLLLSKLRLLILYWPNRIESSCAQSPQSPNPQISVQQSLSSTALSIPHSFIAST